MATRDEIEGWLAGAATGDRRAFRSLYAATSSKLYGVCLRILTDPAEAEDAMQDAYERIWRNAWRYESNGLSPITWMAAVARNGAIDRLRRRRRRDDGLGGPAPRRDARDAVAAIPDHGPGPERQAEMRDEAGRIRDCLRELDARRAEAVRRAYLEGESHAELSDRFGLPVNTVKTWLRRSLIALRECMSR